MAEPTNDAVSDERLREIDTRCAYCKANGFQRPNLCEDCREVDRILALSDEQVMAEAGPVGIAEAMALKVRVLTLLVRRTQPSAGEVVPVAWRYVPEKQTVSGDFVWRLSIHYPGSGWRSEPLYATPPDQSRVERLGALNDIAAERQRQISTEGWTAEHDDQHADGEMALAAACYAAPVPIRCEWPVSDGARSAGEGSAAFPPTQWLDAWPWEEKWWKPSDERRNLVKAGALILAEIERLDRQALQGGRS